MARKRVVTAKPSKDACQTCRIRRVKCDESRPSCTRCTSTGRTCDGYPDRQQSKTVAFSASKRLLLPIAPHPQSPSPSPPLSTPSPFAPYVTDYDRRAFVLFQQEVCWPLSRISPSPQWIQIALQLSLEQAPIFYGITAVASIYRAIVQGCHPCKGLILDDTKLDLAINQYTKAVVALQKYIDSALRQGGHVEPILMACTLFVCYELMHGRGDLAINHLLLGRRIGKEAIAPKLKTSSRSLTTSSMAVTKGILDMYDQLQSDSVVDFTQPSDSIGYGDVKKEDSPPIPMTLATSVSFETLDEAKAHLDTIAKAQYMIRQELIQRAKDRICLDNQGSSDWATNYCLLETLGRVVGVADDAQLQHRLASLKEGHSSWRRALHKLVHRYRQHPPRLLLWMQIAYFYSYYITRHCRETHEVTNDELLDDFTTTVDVLEHYIDLQSTEIVLPPESSRELQRHHHGPETPRPFTMDYGILPTLYLITLKCRDRALRQRAIKLLRDANRQEELHDNDVRYVFAQRVDALEMDGFSGAESSLVSEADSAQAHDGSHHIPENARFVEVVIAGPDGTSRMKMLCSRFVHERDGELELMEFEGPGPRCPSSEGMRMVRRSVYPYRAGRS